MPQGLQVWDAAGNLVLDTSTKVLKRGSQITFTASTTTDQTVPVPSGATYAAISAVPTTSGGDASLISGEVSGSNLVYKARVADGNTYTLNVMFF